MARVTGPAGMLLAALLALVAVLTVAGGANPLIAVDTGSAVRYGLPIAQLLVELSVGLTFGALGLALFALSSHQPEFGRALDIAATAAAIWTVSAAVSTVFGYSSSSPAAPILSSLGGHGVGSYLTETGGGRAWLITTLIGAVLTVLCFMVRNLSVLGLITPLAAIGLLPLATQGHARDGTLTLAVTASWLQLLFAGFWLGGLLTIALLDRTLSPARLMAVLPRYSNIAVIAFVVVGVSGTVTAVLRVGRLSNLVTPHGILVLVAVAVFLALGVFGAVQRRVIIMRLDRAARRRLFWTLAPVQLALLGVVEGMSTALAMLAAPVASGSPSASAGATPAEYLTGSPLPPEVTPVRFFTAWNFDLPWAIICASGVIFYVVGVARLRRRGDSWPRHRTVLWLAGTLLVLWSTNGSPGVYGQYLFSAQLLQHLLLATAIPVLLVLAAPVTLAVRTVERRTDGSRGAREWMLLLARSRIAALVLHPVVAAALWAASLWAFYYSPLFRAATVDPVAHEGALVLFLLLGCLFERALVGSRAAFPMRLTVLLVAIALSAAMGLLLISNTGLLLPEWYGATGRSWGATPLQDQQASGGIVWVVGGVSGASLLVTLVVSRRRRRDTGASPLGDRASVSAASP
jgi:putative copper resistance protein D